MSKYINFEAKDTESYSKEETNIFTAPTAGWYKFPGGLFKLSDKQTTELIIGNNGLEPKEYLEKIAHKKEDL